MHYSQDEIKTQIPKHLHQFISVQDYSTYTARDQALWRYLMNQLIDHLKGHTHTAYLEGLAKTGINSETIPSIDEMNACLAKVGWKAVVVDGFIPPQIFMEFQTLKILTIAVDMRSFEHVLYTPAPDILHESAGHAPFIVDIDYSEFLQKFGEVGVKAMYTKADFEIYEAIRHLSIIKECTNTTASEIIVAEEDLKEKLRKNKTLSEAALLTRLHWWTVEYGLLGDVDDYTIFGAGLLSSLGESINCLNNKRVKKIPLTVNSVQTPYDITEEQPQLFVTKSCKHLSQVLDAFSNHMAYKKGGADSIQMAINSEVICTVLYSTGVSVSGIFTRLQRDIMGNETYIGTVGPTQLAYDAVEIEGHGIDDHLNGFGSPVGRLKNVFKPISQCTIGELELLGITLDKIAVLEYLSGVTVRGVLKKILRHAGKNIVFTFEDCTVSDLSGNILFEPSWGIYDLAVGDRIVSVYSGSADKSKFEVFKQKSSEIAIEKYYTDEEIKLFKIYQILRDYRQSKNVTADEIRKLYSKVKMYENDWLIRFELLELAIMIKNNEWKNQLIHDLKSFLKKTSNYKTLVALAFKRLKIDYEVAD